ncbi:hypothetical protein SAMN05421869_117158 [Nonomuraea jiangxiensis]|uniref:Uncharacterized protein n=1 Tax=Nonomuraea jiangxiensis TaxID=633440 RepID=A0A1G9DJ69_9ACTN|nr:hypothetical protein SAMN05421869_117158 [Nonomuraea jiangxiensis]
MTACPALPTGAAYDRMPFTRRRPVALAAFVIEAGERPPLAYVPGGPGGSPGTDEARAGIAPGPIPRAPAAPRALPPPEAEGCGPA